MAALLRESEGNSDGGDATNATSAAGASRLLGASLRVSVVALRDGTALGVAFDDEGRERLAEAFAEVVIVVGISSYLRLK